MQAWKIICKDLRLLLRDRIAFLMLLVMPLLLTAMVGFSTNELVSNLLRERIVLLLVDQNGGEAAQQLTQSLTESERFTVHKVDSRRVSETLVREFSRAAIVVIGPRFGEKIDGLELNDFLNFPKGKLATGLADLDIEVISREQIINLGPVIVSQLVTWKVVEVAYERMLERFALIRVIVDANPPKVPDGVSQDSDGLAQAAVSEDRVYRFLLPSQAVLFTFFLVSIMARSFMAERTRGTLQRLRMAPISDSTLIMGKTIPFFLVSVVQGTLLFSSGWAIFGMPVGQRPEILFLVILCTSLTATCLGLLVSVCVRTDQQVTIVSTFVILGMAGLSGCLMPREWLPLLLKRLSLMITPHAWALVAYEELLSTSAPDGSRVALCCLILLAFSFAFFGVSLWRLRSAT